jgi:hypothetical protein
MTHASNQESGCSLTWKLEAMRSSETSVNLHRSTRRDIAEDSVPQEEGGKKNVVQAVKVYLREESCINDLPSIVCEINYEPLFQSFDDRLLWNHLQ